MAEDRKRGQDRADDARRAAQDRGAQAHGPGGNPDKDRLDDDIDTGGNDED